MTGLANQAGGMIPHEIMLARLEQSQQMREFFVQMWLQNPSLAKDAGERIRAMLAPLDAGPKWQHPGCAVLPVPTFRSGVE